MERPVVAVTVNEPVNVNGFPGQALPPRRTVNGLSPTSGSGVRSATFTGAFPFPGAR